MSLTRRSFVKKSAYSAAAVTVLGTGVGLGEVSNPPTGTIYQRRTVVYKKFNIVEYKTNNINVVGAQVITEAIKDLISSPNNGINIPGPTGGSTSTFLSQGSCNTTGPWVIEQINAGTPGPGVVFVGTTVVNGITMYNWTVTFNDNYTVIITNFKS